MADILGHLANEAQRQMKLIVIHPARAGHAAVETGEALADGFGEFERDEKPDHQRAPSGRLRRKLITTAAKAAAPSAPAIDEGDQLVEAAGRAEEVLRQRIADEEADSGRTRRREHGDDAALEIGGRDQNRAAACEIGEHAEIDPGGERGRDGKTEDAEIEPHHEREFQRDVGGDRHERRAHGRRGVAARIKGRHDAAEQHERR